VNKYADKTSENKSQSISSGDYQMQNSGESTFQFVDNRPESIAQRKLQEMVNKSPHVKQSAPLQAIADTYTPKNSLQFVDNRLKVAQMESIKEIGSDGSQINADKNVIQLLKSTQLTNRIKQGPPPTYLLDDKYIKKFNTQEQAEKMHKNWFDAWVGGLPTPGFNREKLEDTNDWVFWSKKAIGDTFFQFSKPGHLDKFKGWLDTQPKGRLVDLEQIFNGYRVGDAQGLYENKPWGKIEFIDIQKKVSAGEMKEIGKYITKRINPPLEGD